MGRAPCCDKANVKKGPWSPEEDSKLRDFIEKNGTGGNWIALPQKAGLRRCGKSCRLRWLNYLRPNIKHGDFSEEEDRIICSLYATIGSRWSIIAAQLPGRTDNDIKNYWNTKLKKKLMAFAAASSTSNFSATSCSFQRSTIKQSSISGSSQLNSLYNYNNFSSSPSTNPISNTTKAYMTQPFSCQPVTSSSTTTSLSLFQTQMQNQNQQYYQPLMFGSDNQQTSGSSNNSDNGGSCGNIKPDMGSFQNFNNNSNNNKVVVPRGFDEQEDTKGAFMLNGYDHSSLFLSHFDNMNSSTGATALMDFYDMDQGGDIKQLNMNINDLSLINIGDTTQTQQVISTKMAPQDIKDKDQRMMMYYFNNNYC